MLISLRSTFGRPDSPKTSCHADFASYHVPFVVDTQTATDYENSTPQIWTFETFLRQTK